jgi:hypothetical protein
VEENDVRKTEALTKRAKDVCHKRRSEDKFE